MMTLKRRVMLVAIAGALSLAASCEKRSRAKVKVDSSSTVFLITEAVAEEFHKSSSAKVSVGVAGTGGGLRKFCAGEIDVANASRPIKPSEATQCEKHGIEYVELPVAYDGLAVVVNAKNTWAQNITVAELRKIWEPEAQNSVTRWSQVRQGWPDKELHLYGAGVDSGTYDCFTKAIVGEEHSSRGDFTASEDDDVLVRGVSDDELALGFFGYAYYVKHQHKLRVLPIDDGKVENGAGPILPSPSTVRDGSYQPLSRPLFIYVARKSLDRPEVAAFVRFYLERASALVSEVGYVPLPDRAYALGQRHADAHRTGSMFQGQGSRIGVLIEQLLSPEEPDDVLQRLNDVRERTIPPAAREVSFTGLQREPMSVRAVWEFEVDSNWAHYRLWVNTRLSRGFTASTTDKPALLFTMQLPGDTYNVDVNLLSEGPPLHVRITFVGRPS